MLDDCVASFIRFKETQSQNTVTLVGFDRSGYHFEGQHVSSSRDVATLAIAPYVLVYPVLILFGYMR